MSKLYIHESRLTQLRALMELVNDDENRIEILKYRAEVDYLHLTFGATGKSMLAYLTLSSEHAEDVLDEFLRIPKALSDVEHPNYTFFRGLSSIALERDLLRKIKNVFTTMVNPIYQEVAFYQQNPVFG